MSAVHYKVVHNQIFNVPFVMECLKNEDPVETTLNNINEAIYEIGAKYGLEANENHELITSLNFIKIDIYTNFTNKCDTSLWCKIRLLFDKCFGGTFAKDLEARKATIKKLAYIGRQEDLEGEQSTFAKHEQSEVNKYVKIVKCAGNIFDVHYVSKKESGGIRTMSLQIAYAVKLTKESNLSEPMKIQQICKLYKAMLVLKYSWINRNLTVDFKDDELELLKEQGCVDLSGRRALTPEQKKFLEDAAQQFVAKQLNGEQSLLLTALNKYINELDWDVSPLTYLKNNLERYHPKVREFFDVYF
jgi:hypothetical protein